MLSFYCTSFIVVSQCLRIKKYMCNSFYDPSKCWIMEHCIPITYKQIRNQSGCLSDAHNRTIESHLHVSAITLGFEISQLMFDVCFVNLSKCQRTHDASRRFLHPFMRTRYNMFIVLQPSLITMIPGWPAIHFL